MDHLLAPRASSESIEQFCEKLVIQDKRGQLVRLRLNDVQTHLSKQLTGRDIVLKARQVGISTFIQALLFQEQMDGGARTATLCHEDELTSVLRRMTDRFYENYPDDLRPPRKYANARLTTYPTLNSEGSISTVGGTAGHKKGRGGSLTHIHGSEVAFWPDAEGVMSAAMQAGDPAIILESTANGAQGYFYNLVMEALDGNSDWALHFYPWWWEPAYATPCTDPLTFTDEETALMQHHGLTAEQINWRRGKQRELKHLFLQEYPEDPQTCFLLSGQGYFGDLSGVFTAPLGAVYQPDHEYVAGLDFGQTVDYTVLCILDKTANVQVELLRLNRLPWSEMRRQIRERCAYWHVKVLWPEENSMSANLEELKKEWRAAGITGRIVPFKTTNESKVQQASVLHEALHERELKLLDTPEQRREFMAFQAKQTALGAWQLAAAHGEHDDIVMADLLAAGAMYAPRGALMA